MSGARWTTGLGLVVGGVGGAVAALFAINTRPEPIPAIVVSPEVPATAAAIATAPASADPEPAPAAPPASSVSETPPLVEPAPEASGAPLPGVVSPGGAAFGSAPALEVPATREALLKAQLYCDKRRDFDECSRAAAALEAGTAGPADPKQAKRFRRIALTHSVAQCEAGSAHACFVLAAKYRTGGELAPSPERAETLEKRGLELCRLGRAAPECPPS